MPEMHLEDVKHLCPITNEVCRISVRWSIHPGDHLWRPYDPSCPGDTDSSRCQECLADLLIQLHSQRARHRSPDQMLQDSLGITEP